MLAATTGAFEQRERFAVIVRRQARIYAQPALLYEMEAAAKIKANESPIARPRIHAYPRALEARTLLIRPCENHIDEAAPRVPSRSRNAMQIQMRSDIVIAPDGGVLIRDRKHADDRFVDHDAIERFCSDLGENRRVGELWPDAGALFPLSRSSVRVGRANVRKICGSGWLNLHLEARMERRGADDGDRIESLQGMEVGAGLTPKFAEQLSTMR